MLAVHAYTPLPDDEEAPRRKANPAFNRLVHAYSNNVHLPMLERGHELELISLVQDLDCVDSKNALIEHHMGFLVGIANKSANMNGLEDHLDDLYEEAIEGFIRSIYKFKSIHNARLATLARHYVVAQCYRYVMDMKHLFRVGTNFPAKAAFYRLAEIRKEFHKIYDRQMTTDIDDLLKAEMISGIPAKALKAQLEIISGANHYSLEDIQIHDMRDQDQPENRVAKKSGRKCLQSHIEKVADSLIDRDRDILLTMLSDPEQRAEMARVVAERHDISVERVRQIYRGGLQNIRRSLADAGIRHMADIA